MVSLSPLAVRRRLYVSCTPFLNNLIIPVCSHALKSLCVFVVRSKYAHPHNERISRWFVPLLEGWNRIKFPNSNMSVWGWDWMIRIFLTSHMILCPFILHLCLFVSLHVAWMSQCSSRFASQSSWCYSCFYRFKNLVSGVSGVEVFRIKTCSYTGPSQINRRRLVNTIQSAFHVSAYLQR